MSVRCTLPRRLVVSFTILAVLLFFAVTTQPARTAAANPDNKRTGLYQVVNPLRCVAPAPTPYWDLAVPRPFPA